MALSNRSRPRDRAAKAWVSADIFRWPKKYTNYSNAFCSIRGTCAQSPGNVFEGTAPSATITRRVGAFD